MFITVSFASLITAILFEAVKRLGGRSAADFIFNRIKKKLKKNHNLDVEKEGVTEKELELFREVLQEELQAFGIKEKEIDLLILKGIQKLSDEHHLIIRKMENIEGLLIELTTGLLYEVQIRGTDVPFELSERMIENFLTGDNKAEEQLMEYIEDGHYSKDFGKSLEKYQPFRQAYLHEELLVQRFLRHFEEDEDQIDKLAMLSDLWSILGTKSLSNTKIIRDIVLEIIRKKDVSSELSLSNLLKFLHLLDTTDSLDLVDAESLEEIKMFFLEQIEDIPYYTKIEMTYFLLKLQANIPSLFNIIEEALGELTGQKFSDKFVKESATVSKKILKFFQKETKLNIKKSIRALKSLIKRFEHRKFAKSTALLEGQLTRTLAETNLLATQIPEEIEDEHIRNMKQVLLDLVDILVKGIDKQGIKEEHRITIWKIIDNCVFILNRVAVINTNKVLVNWETDIATKHGLFSEDWGEYRRHSEEEIKKTVRKVKLSRSFIKRVELEKTLSEIEELPEPPKEEKKKKIKI